MKQKRKRKMNKIATLYGKPLEEFTKEELIDAISKLAEYYETRIKNLKHSLTFERRRRR
jgi:hypothetical protein